MHASARAAPARASKLGVIPLRAFGPKYGPKIFDLSKEVAVTPTAPGFRRSSRGHDEESLGPRRRRLI